MLFFIFANPIKQILLKKGVLFNFFYSILMTVSSRNMNRIYAFLKAAGKYRLHRYIRSAKLSRFCFFVNPALSKRIRPGKKTVRFRYEALLKRTVPQMVDILYFLPAESQRR